MKRLCKCHGVSGSCQFQTCWMRVAEFNVIGSFLRETYNKAIKVTSNRRMKRSLTHQLTIESISSSNINSNEEIPFLHKNDDEKSYTESLTYSNDFGLPMNRLVYSEESPDYCNKNSTLGRNCSKRKGNDVTPEERKSCRNLCRNCGLRVKRQKKKVNRQCNCRFQWCCKVHCEICENEEETYTCATMKPVRMFNI